MLSGRTGVTSALANLKVSKRGRLAAERSELVGSLQERREERDPVFANLHQKASISRSTPCFCGGIVSHMVVPD